jgi:hypothetical protein
VIEIAVSILRVLGDIGQLLGSAIILGWALGLLEIRKAKR